MSDDNETEMVRGGREKERCPDVDGIKRRHGVCSCESSSSVEKSREIKRRNATKSTTLLSQQRTMYISLLLSLSHSLAFLFSITFDFVDNADFDYRLPYVIDLRGGSFVLVVEIFGDFQRRVGRVLLSSNMRHQSTSFDVTFLFRHFHF